MTIDEEYKYNLKHIKNCRKKGHTHYCPDINISYECMLRLTTDGYKCYLHQSIFGDDHIVIRWDEFNRDLFEYEYTVDMLNRYIKMKRHTE